MRAHARTRALPAIVLAGLLLGGCADEDDAPATPTTPDSPSTATSAPAPTEPEPTQEETDGTDEGPAEGAPLVDRLLPTDLVPGLNEQWRWQDGDTGAATQDAFGVCAKVDLGSIGASEVVERTYFPPDDSDDNAAEQVAEFPDARTARLAYSVLRSWYERCGSRRADYPGLKVGPLTDVPVTSGKARWYLTSWAPPGEETGRFEAFGTVLDGTRIAVLRMTSSGQDYDYPAGQEPMVGMVRAAAGWVD